MRRRRSTRPTISLVGYHNTRNTKRRPSTGVSTEDIDEGVTGGTGGVNPGSSNENSLITENTKKGHDEGEQRTEN